MKYALLVIVIAATTVQIGAQGPPGPPQPPPTGKAAAPVDLTGYWVSVISEDWRWRMVTPLKGDFASVPLTLEGPEGRRRLGSGEG